MRGMKRVLFGLLAVVLLWFGGRAIVHALASDETKIRWVIEDMTDGFNETRMNPIMTGLAQDFVDADSGFGKDDVRAGLAQLFLQSKDPQTKRFPYRVQVSPEEFSLHVQRGEPRTAELDLVAHFDESAGEEWHPAWTAKVHAELQLGPDGWKIRRAHVVTLEGKRPR